MSETEPTARRTDERLEYGEWADALRGGELLGQECADCGHITAAPKAACARCGSRSLDTILLPTEGKVYSETTITVPPKGFEGEYQLAIVELGKARVLARIESAVEIGDRVAFADVIETNAHPAPTFETA